MNTKRKCQVVMLPTNGKALINNQLYLSMDSNPMKLGLTSRAFTSGENFNKIPQHLYITSDEEIKEGDYVIIKDKLISQFKYKKNTCEEIFCKKIIAPTDNLRLICKDEFGGIDNQFFPQPPQQFIEDYIKEYNKGNIITEVEVEYESKNISDDEGFFNLEDILKLNPDNTINIKPTKDSWSREEVKKLLFQYDTFILNYYTKNQGLPLQKDIDKWIEQNM